MVHAAPAAPDKAGGQEISEENHPAIAQGRIGVLLVNLGTPDAPTAKAVRRYLREFLSDQRVVDLPRALWLPILYGAILPIRSGATAKNYAKIWRAESNESPLRYYTRKQADGLGAEVPAGVDVDWAMRYGAPNVRERLSAMQKNGCTRIVVVPLYPQYSATTTASVVDAVYSALREMRWQPAVRIAPPFYDDTDYIAALAESARARLNALSFEPERVLLSYHGLPERYFRSGDPYFCHCAKTSRLLRIHMTWTEEFAPMTFQSKFGREKWLEPATEETLVDLAKAGVKKAAIMAPSFVSDCIETLEELDIAAREAFVEAGGEEFAVIPCLNDAPGMIAALRALVMRETAGWRD